MMKSILLIIALCIGGGVSAQETIAPSKTLENQFDEVYRTSNSYNTYKVIRKVRFQNLKLQTLDSVSRYKKQLSEKDSLLRIEKQNYKSVKEQESKTQMALSDAKKNENNISFFGSELSKTNYNLLLWSIIILLLVSLLYFIYKFNNNKYLSKEAKNSLIEVASELEQHRKKALEREQKLRRQLQDEINKQRNS